MSSLVIRLAGPVQSWGTYRVSYTSTPSAPLPTKSGVAGLLGALIGEKNYLDLLSRFSFWVRVDHAQPVAVDLQVASSPKPSERDSFRRAATLASAKKTDAPRQLTNTALPSLANREFLPFSEFICGLDADTADVADWYTSARRPTYMPYLGRQANAPTFPLLLGWSENDAHSVLAELPHVARHRLPDDSEKAELPLYEIDGSYERTGPEVRHRREYVTTASETRERQLAWVQQRLNR